MTLFRSKNVFFIAHILISIKKHPIVMTLTIILELRNHLEYMLT